MTARARLERARRVLAVASVLRAVLWGTAAAMLVKAAVTLLQLGIGWPLLVGGALVAGSTIVGLLVFGLLLWQNRGVRSSAEVALWLEGKVPALRYSLVTLAEGTGGSSAALEQSVAQTGWVDPIRSSLLRRLGLPAVLLAAGGSMILVLPSVSATHLIAGPADQETGSAPSSGDSDPFHSFRVLVTPPAYSRQARQRLDQPEAVTSLTGSEIRIEGDRGLTTDKRGLAEILEPALGTLDAIQPTV